MRAQRRMDQSLSAWTIFRLFHLRMYTEIRVYEARRSESGRPGDSVIFGDPFGRPRATAI